MNFRLAMLAILLFTGFNASAATVDAGNCSLVALADDDCWTYGSADAGNALPEDPLTGERTGDPYVFDFYGENIGNPAVLAFT